MAQSVLLWREEVLPTQLEDHPVLASHVIVEPQPVSGFAEQDSAAQETAQSAEERGRHFIWKLTEGRSGHYRTPSNH